MVDRVADALVDHRRFAAILAAVLLLAMGAVTKVPQVDGSIEGFDLPDNPHRQLAERLLPEFGPPPAMQMVITPREASVAAVLSDLVSLDARLSAAVPDFRIASLHSFAAHFATLGIAVQGPIDSALHRIATLPLAGDLVASDTASFLMLVAAPPALAPDLIKIDSILSSSFTSIKSIQTFSIWHLERDVRAAIQRDLAVLSILVLAVAGIVLWWAFRTLNAVFFVLGLTAGAVLAASATLSVLSYSLNVATMLVVPTVIVLSLADAVHLLTGYALQVSSADPETRLRTAVHRYLVPSMLTSVTTAAAFFSLILSDAANLRAMGLVSGVAVILAYILAYFLGPYLLVAFNVSARGDPHLSGVLRFVDGRTKSLGLAFLVVVPISVFLLPLLNFSTPPDHFLPKGYPVTRARDVLAANFSDLASLHIVLEPRTHASPEPPLEATAATAHEITRELASLDGVEHLTSASTLLEAAHALNLHPLAVAALMKTNPFISKDGLRHRIEVKVTDAAIIPRLEPDVRHVLERFSSKTEWVITGSMLALEYVNTQVVIGLLKSFLLSSLVVVIIIALLTRSAWGMLVAVAANAVPLSAAILLFSILRLEVSVLSATVLVLSLGLVVDDTLHTLFRLVKEGRRLEELPYSMATTSILLSACFGCFMVSSFVPVRILGGVVAAVMLVGLLAEFTVVPWLFGLRLHGDARPGT